VCSQRSKVKSEITAAPKKMPESREAFGLRGACSRFFREYGPNHAKRLDCAELAPAFSESMARITRSVWTARSLLPLFPRVWPESRETFGLRGACSRFFAENGRITRSVWTARSLLPLFPRVWPESRETFGLRGACSRFFGEQCSSTKKAAASRSTPGASR
jgi:hypothetical protein